MQKTCKTGIVAHSAKMKPDVGNMLLSTDLTKLRKTNPVRNRGFYTLDAPCQDLEDGQKNTFQHI